MSANSSREIRSTVTSEGTLELSIAVQERPVPGDNEVLLEVGAAPINPSDLALLISFAANLDTLSVSGSGDQTVTSTFVPHRHRFTHAGLQRTHHRRVQFHRSHGLIARARDRQCV